MKALIIASTDANGSIRETIHPVDSYDPLNWYYDPRTRTATVYEGDKIKLVVAGVNVVEFKSEWYPPKPPDFQNKADKDGTF